MSSLAGVGRLSHPTSGEGNLRARSLIGRSRTAGLSLVHDSISIEHAVLAWRGGQWQVRDLGSTNGTRVNGQRLEPGVQRCLQQDDVLSFGLLQDEWRLEDDAPPQLFARRTSDHYEVRAASGLLALPSEAEPLVQVLSVGADRWTCTNGPTEAAIVDGQAVTANGETWEVFLPICPEDTHRIDPPAFPLRQMALIFHVSQDEETVAIGLRGPGVLTELESRAHNYLLLHLARRRLQDVALPEPEQGWIERSDLASDLRMDPAHLNVQIFRLRKSFSEAQVADVGNLVESRGRPSQLRIGPTKLSIRGL